MSGRRHERLLENQIAVEVHTLGAASMRFKLRIGSTILDLKQEISGPTHFREFIASVLGEQCYEDCNGRQWGLPKLPAHWHTDDSLSQYVCSPHIPSGPYMKLVLGTEVQQDIDLVKGHTYQLIWDFDKLSNDLLSEQPFKTLPALRTISMLGPRAIQLLSASLIRVKDVEYPYLRLLAMRMLVQHAEIELESRSATEQLCTWIRNFSVFRTAFGNNEGPEVGDPIQESAIDWVWKWLLSAASSSLASIAQKRDHTIEFVELVGSVVQQWLAAPSNYADQLGAAMREALPQVTEGVNPLVEVNSGIEDETERVS